MPDSRLHLLKRLLALSTVLPAIAGASPSDVADPTPPTGAAARASAATDLQIVPGPAQNSKTVQMLLELQAKQAPLEAGDRSPTRKTVLPPPAVVAPAPPVQPSVRDLYKKALDE